MTTKPTTPKDIQRASHKIDARGMVLGRLSTKVATLLAGKNKPYFVRNLDCGDYVVVANAKQIVTTGKKESQKMYQRYSGYPGGLTQKTLGQMKKENPHEIIRHAVAGMLPNNKLKDQMLTRLTISD